MSTKEFLKKLDKITVKLVALYFAMVFVALTVISTLFLITTSLDITNRDKVELLQLTQSISDFAENRFSGSKKVLKEELRIYFGGFNPDGKTKIIVYDDALKVLFADGADIELSKKETALKALDGETVCIKSKEGKNLFDAACPIEINGEIIGAVNVLRHSDAKSVYVKRALSKAFLWTLFISFVSAVVILVFAILLSLRIKGFTRKIKDMTNDNRTEKLEINGNDEISELAEAFNDLSEKVNVLEKQRTEFVSNASHELKTPLSSIKLMADSIIQTPDISIDYVREFLADMNEEVERLNRIVNKLLYITKMDTLAENMSGTLELINLKDIVAGIKKNLLPIAEMENKELAFEECEDILIMANKDILWQAVYNIVDNALKYTPKDGRVEVSLVKDGKKAIITIKDNGVGIAAEDVKRIFDRFYRVDKARSRATGGTGLGLSIAQSAIEFHNGTIEVTSEINVGSEFRIILPLVDWL